MMQVNDYTDTDFTETEIGLIPADWDVLHLHEVTLKTKTYDPTKQADKEFLYVDVSSISNEINRINGYSVVIGAEAPSRARKVIHSGDTIFATVRPYLRNIAQVPSDLHQSICSTGFCVLRANPETTSPDYLFFTVLTDNFVSRVVALQRGSSYPAVSDEVVKAQLVPLPPLAEQRRIAAVLNAIQDEIAAQDDLIAEAREFKRSLMQRLFTYGAGAEPAETKETEIGEIPAHWEISECERIAEKITVGIVVKPASYYVEDGIPAFRSLNVREDRLVANDLVYISSEANDTVLSKSRLKTNDVLIVRTGYPGTSCTVPQEFDGANCIDLVIVRSNGVIQNRFLSRYFNTEQAKKQVLANKTGLAQQHLNVGAVKRMLVPIPSSAEQTEIVNALTDADEKIAVEEDRKAAMKDLFKTMLHQLMTGQIRLLSDDGLPL